MFLLCLSIGQQGQRGDFVRLELRGGARAVENLSQGFKLRIGKRRRRRLVVGVGLVDLPLPQIVDAGQQLAIEAHHVGKFLERFAQQRPDHQWIERLFA